VVRRAVQLLALQSIFHGLAVTLFTSDARISQPTKRITTQDQHMDALNKTDIEARISQLTVEHRDLDSAIAALQSQPVFDELAVRRMKRRKLLIKDQLAWLERQLSPDVPA
jgi:hypothetical protein